MRWRGLEQSDWSGAEREERSVYRIAAHRESERRYL